MQINILSANKKDTNYDYKIYEKSWNTCNLRRALLSIEDIPNLYSWDKALKIEAKI